jgi:gliding motility-associated-like protein
LNNNRSRMKIYKIIIWLLFVSFIGYLNLFSKTPFIKYKQKQSGPNALEEMRFNSLRSIGRLLPSTDSLSRDMEASCQLLDITFSISDDQAEPGDMIRLQHDMPEGNGVTYTWMINGQAYGQERDLEYIIQETGLYNIYLWACDATNCVSSATRIVRSRSCQEGQAGREWYFGENVGLRFEENGTVRRIPSSMSSFSAAAIAYGAQGEMLFYSNGEEVWNQSHNVMANGTDLLGSQRSSQAIALCHPGNSDLWYLFYPETYDGVNFNKIDYKMYYSIIDMSQNGGLGRVVEKNRILFDYSTEKITAVRHCNNRDWWIISHETRNNVFLVFSFTDTGLNEVPIRQELGIAYEAIAFAAGGFIRPSRSGSLLAVTKETSAANAFNGSFELFRFDRSTGMLSNELLIFNDAQYCYGTEFSPDETKVYTHKDKILYQFDISSRDEAAIRNTAYQIPYPYPRVGAMKLGPDDILYISGPHRLLNAFLNPNEGGAGSNFTTSYIDTSPNTVFVSLPNFPNDIYSTRQLDIVGPEIVCDTSDVVRYHVPSYCDIPDFDWFYTGTGSIQQIAEDTILFYPGNPGIDTLIVEYSTACGVWSDTLLIRVDGCRECNIEFSLAESDTQICLGESAFLQLQSNADSITIRALPDGAPIVIENGWIELGALLSDVCYEIHFMIGDFCDSIHTVCVQVQAFPELVWMDSTGVICPGEQIEWEFDAFAAMVSVVTDADTVALSGNQLQFPILYEDMCTTLLLQAEWCTSEVLACVTVDTLASVSFETISLCPGDSLLIDNQWLAPGDRYQIFIPVDGVCDSVIVYDLLAFEEIAFELYTAPTCDDDATGSIEIIPSSNFTVAWGHTASNSTQLEGLSSGMYHVTLTDDNGCEVRLSPEVSEFTWIWPELEIAIFGCEDNTVGSISLENVDTYTLIWNGQEIPGGKIEELPPGEYELQVTNNQDGCHRDTMITIESRAELNVRLPISTSITEGTIIVLEVEVDSEGALSFLWSPARWLSCVACRNPLAQPRQTIVYTVEVTDAFGCSGKDSIEIIVDSAFPVYIPNAFSPNGDGVNDVFEVYSGNEQFELSALEIFDRYGSKMYACQGMQCTWDGRFKGQLVQPGLYIYVVQVNTPDGIKIRSGEVQVLR